MAGNYKKMKRLSSIFLRGSILGLFIFCTAPFNWERVSANPLSDPDSPNPLYLPIIKKPAPREVLLGVYTENYLGNQSTIDNEVKAIDTWSGKHLTIVGTFIAIEDQYPFYNIPVPLGLIWDSGYTPFVNLGTSKTLSNINSGSMDNQIRAMAQAFKQWRDEGLEKSQNRRAFLALMQEMDGYWVSYHGTPADFILAFHHVRDIFIQEGAGPAVRWVFAPNGWTDPSDPPFEDYYPGDSYIEVISFSGYNSGYCSSAAWKSWDMPDKVYNEYIQRIRVLAPSKPIFISQTATTAYTQYGKSTQAKNEWLVEAYTLLANSQGVSGVIYFNKQAGQSCDWAFYLPSGSKYEGYIQGVNRSEYIYIGPEELATKDLSQ